MCTHKTWKLYVKGNCDNKNWRNVCDENSTRRRGDALKRCEADGEQLEKLSAYELSDQKLSACQLPDQKLSAYQFPDQKISVYRLLDQKWSVYQLSDQKLSAYELPDQKLSACIMCIYELPDQICLTLWNAHRGFIYTALEKYAGGNGDMEVHTAHIRHQFQVGADLHTGEKCNHIKLQNLSPLSSATVKSWLNIQNAKSRLHFFLLLNLRKIHKFRTISKSGCFPLVNQRNWGAHPITTPRSEFLDSSCCVHFLQCQNNHSGSVLWHQCSWNQLDTTLANSTQLPRHPCLFSMIASDRLRRIL